MKRKTCASHSIIIITYRWLVGKVVLGECRLTVEHLRSEQVFLDQRTCDRGGWCIDLRVAQEGRGRDDGRNDGRCDCNAIVISGHVLRTVRGHHWCRGDDCSYRSGIGYGGQTGWSCGRDDGETAYDECEKWLWNINIFYYNSETLMRLWYLCTNIFKIYINA